MVEEAGEKVGQHPDVVTAAIVHGDIFAAYHSSSPGQRKPASPTALPLEKFGRASSTSCRVTSASRAKVGGKSLAALSVDNWRSTDFLMENAPG